MRVLALSILFLFSAVGILVPTGIYTTGRFLWWLIFVTLSFPLVYERIKRKPSPGLMDIEASGLVLLLIHAVSGVTGGIHSPFLSAYILVVLLSALHIDFTRNMVVVAGIIFLEVTPLLLVPPEEGISIGLLIPFMILALIPPIVRFFLRSQLLEKEVLQEQYQRIQDGVASLEFPLDSDESGSAARLLEEKKQEEAFVYAEQMEADLQNLLSVVLASRTEVTRAVIMFYNPEKDRLWVCGAQGREDHIGVNRDKGVRLGEGILGWIAKAGKTVSISDLQNHKERLSYDDGSVPIGSLIVVPIMDQDRLEGLVCIDSVKAHAFSEGDKKLIEHIAKEVIRVLQYYRGQQRLKDQTKEHLTLLDFTKNVGSQLDLDYRLKVTIASAKKIIDFDTCFIFLVEEGERRMAVKAVDGYDTEIIGHSFPLTNGLLTLIVKNRQELAFSNTLYARMEPSLFSRRKENKIFPDGCKIRLPSHSFLGLPMEAEEGVIGVVLFSSRKGDAFTTYNRHVLKIMCNYVSISINEAKTHAKMERLSVTDELTGLLNFRGFQDRLLEMFDRVNRHPEPCSLLMIDIDHFKKVNDTFGHPAGDAVIRKVSNILTKLVRKVDIVARYGGEEFVVLLVNTDTMRALRMAERIRKAVESTPALWKGQKMTMTVSIGVSGQPEDATRQEDLVSSADRALYASKQEGRNRTTLYKDVRTELSEAG
ncbi:MAG: diguanylate cyclase [Nitrospira sp.]|nr:diguanylate cyclase [Candidatus Manganitrophaceae bacterium]HIL34776.1 diguanylate cyclase [Candidatus Manganitrophaceae bacterium]